ncbi:MAG: DUF6118 family protein [Acidiphilium sp.]|jgi:hypothetical protein|nr:DUF6118 family protein [Acidiphilium sp.]MDD4937286.1 DUF6118 family protein [Acidiphilium sp.]
MADRDDNGDRDDNAARAFQDLHAEVIVMRRLVEGLPHEWEDKRPPDYSPDLGAIRKALIAVERRLGEIEAQPALKQTPETYAARIGNAGQSVFREAERVLGQAVTETRDTKRELAGMIGNIRGRAEQRDWLIFWGSIAAACALTLGLVGSPFMASHLPFEWDGTVASVVMGQPTRWETGEALMRQSNQAGWNALVADWHLISGNKTNSKAITACETKAAKFHKAQECLIVVPTRE